MSAVARWDWRWSLVAIVLVLQAGCGTWRQPPPPALVARFFLEADPREAGRAVVLPQSGVSITIAPKPILMEFDFIDVQVVQVPLGRCLAFRLTLAAGRDLFRLTGREQGRRLVLTLNDEVLAARRIDQPIEEGVLMVFLEVPDERLPALAETLRQTSTEIQRRLVRKQ
jgi:hypothetical protein